MSLFSDLFNEKKKGRNEDTKQTELEDKSEELDVRQSSSSEVRPGENYGENMEAMEEEDIEYEIVEREVHPAKIICPDCGGITLEGLDFCDKCGGELQ